MLIEFLFLFLFSIVIGDKRDPAESGTNGKVKSKSLKSTGKMKWTKLTATVATDDVDVENDGTLLMDEDTVVKKGRCCSKNKGPSFMWALLGTFKAPILAAAFFKFCQDSLSFIGPLLLK